MNEEQPKCPVCDYQLTEVMPPGDTHPEKIDYVCEKHGPMVEVTLMFPKRVIDFLTDVQEGLEMPPEEYIYYCIIHAIAADLDSGDIFTPSPKHYVEKYNLKDIFKASNALLPDW